MKYIIKVRNQELRRQIELIINLFLKENDELIFRDEKQSYVIKDYIVIELQYNIYASGIVVTLSACIGNKGYYYSYNRKLIDSSDNSKAIKKGISIVLLKLLEEITGREQGWGILTGIRPIKLFHKLYIEKKSYELVQKKLKDDYLLKTDKVLLMTEIVKKQLNRIPDLYNNQGLSIYIGIPYCPTKCVYCSFPSYKINRRDNSINAFLEAINKEIHIIGKWLKESKEKVDTIYVGGGTPTSLYPEEIDQLFESLSKYIDLKRVKEITVEAGRPDTITDKKLDAIIKWKVNRISINPQSFSEKTLKIIVRNHTIEEVYDKFCLARTKGVETINMDLIVGLPGESLIDIKNSLNQIGTMLPESLTIHTMTFKTASYLAKNKKNFFVADEIEINKMMDYAREWTKEHEYYPYYLYRQKNILGNLENIGYSKEGRECLYNIFMMEEKQTIIALGCGAVSKLVPKGLDKVIRVPNPKDPKTYIEGVEDLAFSKVKKLEEIF